MGASPRVLVAVSCAVATALAGCVGGVTAGPVQGRPLLLHSSASHRAAELSSPAASPGSASAPPYQVTLDRYAEEIDAAVHGHGPGPSVAGYCSIVLDPFRDGLTVYWQGTPAPAVRGILDRAAGQGVVVRVRPSQFDRRTLTLALQSLVPHTARWGISTLSPATNCAALEVGLSRDTSAVRDRVRQAVHPRVPMRFTQRTIRPASGSGAATTGAATGKR